MKNTILLFLILLSTAAASQTNAEKQERWTLGLSFSPDIYYNTTTLISGDLSGYELERSTFNYTAGLVGQLILAPNLAIGTGIAFSQKNFSGTYYCHVCDLVDQEPELIKQGFIEIPLVVRYKLLDKKMSFFLESGLVNGFLSKGISTRNGDLLSNQRFLLSAQFGFGIDFDLGSRLNISLTNTYRQSLSPFFDDDNFKFRALGFATSMVYRIKK